MFAGVLAGRWPPAATLADRLLGREHALPLRPATDREVWGPGGMVDPCTVEAIAAVAAGERGKATEALGILRHATGGAFDHREVGSLRAAVAFPHRMHLGGPWRLNVGDGTARGGSVPWHVLHRAARDADDADALAYASAHRGRDDPAAGPEHGLGPLLRGATDTAWLAAGTSGPAAPPLPAEVWLPSTQVLVARRRRERRTAWPSPSRAGTTASTTTTTTSVAWSSRPAASPC